jgi:glycosyltransferase involved in cell wall biosynthesis
MSRLDRLRLRFGKIVDEPAPGSHFEGSGVELRLLPPARPLRASDLPDADVVIATWWTTAEFVLPLHPSKGRKCYLVQHHEIHPGQPVERVRETLRAPMQKVVVSEWLRGIMAEEYGDTSAVLVPNGVDCSQFHAVTRERNRVPTVGYLHHLLPYKGAEIAIRAIEIARFKRPDLRSIAFGRGPLEDGPADPGLTKFIFRPDQHAIRDVYAACDVWLFASRLEGFGLPLLEAAACGTPLVATPAGAAPEIIASGAGILVEGDNPTAMAEGIDEMLSKSVEEWSLMSARCIEIAQARDWASSVARLESVLLGSTQAAHAQMYTGDSVGGEAFHR